MKARANYKLNIFSLYAFVLIYSNRTVNNNTLFTRKNYASGILFNPEKK